jgi:NAD(P)H-dependent FMN reductase
MFNIPIILASARRERKSPRVATFIVNRLQATGAVQPQLIDLAELNLPIMEERLRMRNDPPPGLTGFADAVRNADALVVVTPEYNNGYPGVLKNALDYLLPEYKRKPVGIVTVSSGDFGGVNALAQLRHIFLHMGAIPVPARLPIQRVQDTFGEDGSPTDPAYQKRADSFIAELLWLTEAIADRKKRDGQTEAVGRPSN